MLEEFQKVALALSEINQTLKSQANEISELRNQVQKLIQVCTPKPICAVIEPDCGYEWMWVRVYLDSNTWSRIKSGEHVTFRGRGWIPDETEKPNPNDENFFWDHWEFNGGINKPMKVTMESPSGNGDDPEDYIAYQGPLLQEFVFEYDGD